MTVLRAVGMAFALYSRIPVPPLDWESGARRYTLYAFPLVGLAVGFPTQIPWGKLLLSFALCFGVSFVIYALQQGLSLWFVNQAVPLAVGIFGSFVGLFALFFPQWVQRCVIWGYYGVLIQAGMNWDPVTRATEFYWVQTQPLEFGLLALWMIVVLAVGRGLFVRKEV